VKFVKNTSKLSVFQLKTGETISIIKPRDIAFSQDVQYHIGIRPEDLSVYAEDTQNVENAMSGVVALAENLGGDGFIHVALKDNTQIRVKAKNALSSCVGNGAILGCAYNKCYLFDENGKTISGVAVPPKDQKHC